MIMDEHGAGIVLSLKKGQVTIVPLTTIITISTIVRGHIGIMIALPRIITKDMHNNVVQLDLCFIKRHLLNLLEG